MGATPARSSGPNSPITITSTLQESTPGDYQIDGEVYHEAVRVEMIPTKLEDGNVTTIAYQQNSDATQSGSRPSSSNSAVDLPPDDQDVLNRTTCTISSTDPQDLHPTRVFQKPVTSTPEEVSNGFKMSAAMPRHPITEKQQVQSSIRRDSGYASLGNGTADQASPPCGQGYTLTSSYQASHDPETAGSARHLADGYAMPDHVSSVVDKAIREGLMDSHPNVSPITSAVVDQTERLVLDQASTSHLLEVLKKNKEQKSRRSRRRPKTAPFASRSASATASKDAAAEPYQGDSDCIINITGSIAQEHMVDLGPSDTRIVRTATLDTQSGQVQPNQAQPHDHEQALPTAFVQPESGTRFEHHGFDELVDASLPARQQHSTLPSPTDDHHIVVAAVPDDRHTSMARQALSHLHGTTKALSDILRSVSDRDCPVKVTQPKTVKSKPRRRITMKDLPQVIEDVVDDAKRDFLIQVAGEIDTKDAQLREAAAQTQDLVSRFEAERDDLQNQALAARESHQTIINKLEAERANLRAQITEQNLDTTDLDQRVKSLRDRGKQYAKFLNGFSSDIGLLRQGNESNAEAMRAHAQEHAEFETNYRAIRHGVLQAVEKFSDFKGRNLNLSRDLMLRVQELTQHCEYLEQQLSEKVGLLTEERDLRGTLEKQLHQPQAEHNRLQGVFKECADKILEKLDALHRFVDDKQKHKEFVALVKKCSEETASLSRQGQASVESVTGVRGLVEALSSSTQKHFDELKATIETGQADPTSILETRVVGLLESLKTDLRSQGDHAAGVTTLRETIATLEERQKANEATITGLNNLIEEHNAQASTLRDRVQQLEASNMSLQQERISAEMANTSLQEKTHDNDVLRQELEKTKAERANATANLATCTDKLQSLQGDKEDLQQCLAEKEQELRRAQQAIPDFEPERRQLHEKAKQDLENLRAELGEQSRSFANKQVGKINQARLEKEDFEKRLGLARAELEPLKADNQLLKEQAKDNWAMKKVDALSADLKSKDVQVRKLSEGEAAFQRSLEEANSRLQEAQDQVARQKSMLLEMSQALESRNRIEVQASSSQVGAVPSRPPRLVDRNNTGHSQAFSSLIFSGLSSAPYQSAIAESQRDAEMLLGHSLPYMAPGQPSGANVVGRYLDLQGMENDGLLERSPTASQQRPYDLETQSPLKVASHFSTQVASADNTQSQRGVQRRVSSPLSERSVSSSHRRAAEQESQESQQRALHVMQAENESTTEDTQTMEIDPRTPWGPKTGSKPSQNQRPVRQGVLYNQSSSPDFMQPHSEPQAKRNYSNKPRAFLSSSGPAMHRYEKEDSQQPNGHKAGSNKKVFMKRSAPGDSANATAQAKKARLMSGPETPAKGSNGRPSSSTRSRQPSATPGSASGNLSIQKMTRNSTTEITTRQSSTGPGSSRKTPGKTSKKVSKYSEMKERFSGAPQEY